MSIEKLKRATSPASASISAISGSSACISSSSNELRYYKDLTNLRECVRIDSDISIKQLALDGQYVYKPIHLIYYRIGVYNGW
jgi:hypothetical protein